MANYPKELVDLLQQYMTDGVMTAKERAVLLRKAESLGVDKDEFDLYIDAEEQKFEQKIDSAKRQAKGKLCPFCEASVPMFTDKCPKCGCNITPEVTKELNDIIENLEDAVVNFKSTKNVDLQRNKANVERYVRKAEMYYGNNKKIQILIAEVKKEMDLVEKRVSADKRKEQVATGATKLIKFIKNIWFWVFVEVLVTMGLYCHYDAKAQEGRFAYQAASGRPRVAEYDAYRSAEKAQGLCTFFGVVAVVATSAYAVKRNKKD